MSTVRLQADKQSIEAEASAWIVQLDGAEPSAEDRKALQEWIGRSPAHREAFERLSSLWDDLNILTELAVPRGADTHPRRAWSIGWPRLAAAIAVVVLVSVAALFGSRFQPDAPGSMATTTPADAPVRSGRFDTAIGQLQTVDLDDGSQAILNTDTEIIVDINPAGRDIYLVRGEALFDVAHDPGRDFRVHARGGFVKAVGTEFSVRLKEASNVVVIVSEGVVELAVVASGSAEQAATDTGAAEPGPASPLARVSAGQVAVFGSGLESLQSMPKDEISRQLSWRGGMLRFDGEPLSEVVAEISRYTTTRIVIASPALEDLRIGGYFKVGETDAMLEALESGFDVRVERIDGNLVHLVESP